MHLERNQELPLDAIEQLIRFAHEKLERLLKLRVDRRIRQDTYAVPPDWIRNAVTYRSPDGDSGFRWA